MPNNRTLWDSDVDDKVVGSDRVLAALVQLGNHPDGLSLDEMSTLLHSAKPTIHRALASLRRAGFATQNRRGDYMLGDEFLRIAFANHEARPETIRIQGLLEALADTYGETVHYAALDGRQVVYRAKRDPRAGAVHLTSMVGGRNPAHATGVGKALLAQSLPTIDAVRNWVGTVPLEVRTPNTKATVESLHEELEKTRQRGFAIDDQENEPGINCIAIPVYLTSPTVPSGAISVSALSYRKPLQFLLDDVDNFTQIVRDYGALPA